MKSKIDYKILSMILMDYVSLYSVLIMNFITMSYNISKKPFNKNHRKLYFHVCHKDVKKLEHIFALILSFDSVIHLSNSCE